MPKSTRSLAFVGPARGIVVAFAAALVVSLLAGSFGVGARASASPGHRVLATPFQAAHGTSGDTLRLQLRGRHLTEQIRALTAAPRATAAVSHRLVALSKARQETLLRLLVKQPSAVRALILPRKDRAVLARIRGARVERAVAVSGRTRVSHRDDFRHPAHDVFRDQLATAQGKVFTLYGARSSVSVRLTFARLKPDAPLSVRGFALGSNLLATKAWTPSSRTLASASAATTGPVNVAVIVATFADSTTPVDMNAIRSTFQGNPGHDAVSYFDEASYGKMSVVPSFFGPYPLATTSSSGCSQNPVQALVNAAAANVNFAQYTRLVFVFNCPWSNFGSATSIGPVGTPQGTVQAAQIALDSRSAADLYSVVHELSHTLGSFLDHAASYVCLPDTFVPPSRFDTGCASAEYGDYFDTLGSPPSGQTPQLDPLHKSKAGWLDATQFPTVTASGTFTLGPYERTSATGQPLALNIPRGQSGTAFTVEYRQPTGYDAWMSSPACAMCNVTQGASIRLAAGAGGGGGGSDTQLLDTTPGTIPSSYYFPIEDARDGALLEGRTFTDPEYGISVKTLSATASGLTVQVTVPAQTCVHAAPTVSAPSSATLSGAAGQTAATTVTLTNRDSAGCAANRFRYYAPSSSSLNVVASPDYVALAPGESTSISLGVSALPLTTAGTYGLSSGGAFRSNSLGTGDATVTGLTYQLTSPADSSAPAAPTALGAQSLGSSAVKVTWSPSSDNVGVVGYRVSRAGQVYTTGATVLVDNYVAAGVAYSYSVQAFDRNGNFSPAATVSATPVATAGTAAPTAPTVTAVASAHGLTVSWTASSDDVGVAYYRVIPCLVPLCIVPASSRSFTAEGLTSRTRFDLQVLAVDGDGRMSGFGYGKYTVYTSVPGTTAPSQPQRLNSPAGSFRNVQLTWAPSTDDKGVGSYAVFRNDRQIATVSSTSYTDTLVGSSSEYYVQAIDADGSLSAPSARIWFPSPSRPSSDTSSPGTVVSSPDDGSTATGTLDVVANASDDRGVTSVELYVDGALKSTKTAAPYTFSLDTTALADGSHWLFTRAYDAAGNYGASPGTSFTVQNHGPADTTVPDVALVDPTAGETVSGPVSITATASDNVGVDSVEISVDNAVVATDSTPPYSASWNAAGAGPGAHTITATALDAAGNADADSITVMHPAPPDTTAPVVSFTSPANGATATGTLRVQAAASDGVGVDRVEFFVDGELAETVTSSPWSFDLDASTLNVGSHALSAKAYDAAGNSSSSQVSVNVPPADSTVPSTPSSVKALLAGTTQVVLTWAATRDNVGVVAYEVYRDGVKVGETATKNYVDSGVAPGTRHAYQVVARDAAGNRSALSSKLNASFASLSTAATGTLAGVVFNQLGKPLANVVVQLTVNGVVKSAKTNSSGVWKLSSLPAGAYTASLSLVGYQVATTVAAALSGQTVVSVTTLAP